MNTGGATVNRGEIVSMYAGLNRYEDLPIVFLEVARAYMWNDCRMFFPIDDESKTGPK